MADDDAVWPEIGGAGLLSDLFGGWPTFRDAEIRSLTIDRRSDSATMAVDYSDGSDEASALRVRIQLKWFEVDELTVSLTDTWLGGIEFKKLGDRIATILDQRNDRLGRVVAARVEAEVAKLDAPADDADEFPSIRLEYR